jgi:hypothetical protein
LPLFFLKLDQQCSCSFSSDFTSSGIPGKFSTERNEALSISSTIIAPASVSGMMALQAL